MSVFDHLTLERPRDHPSQRMIEQFAFDLETQHAGTELEAHVASCATCREAVQKLREERSQFLAWRPVQPFVDSIAPRSSSRIRAWVLRGMAVAAGILLAIVILRPTPDPIHLKGGTPLALEVFVSKGGEPALPLQEATALHAHELLRFAIRSERSGFAIIADIDDQGRFARWFPRKDQPDLWIEGGRQRVLEGSIELDDFAGRERVVLVVSDRPPSEPDVEHALRQAFDRAGGDLDRMTIDLEGAATTSVLLVRAAQ